MDKDNVEAHPLLPSGEWEGFYCYGNSNEQHKMLIELSFEKGIVSGSGTDDVAPFSWSGKYDTSNMKISMVKTYSTHTIDYFGDIDENGIWGTWDQLGEMKKRFSAAVIQHMMKTFNDSACGGFHIWPKRRKSNANAIEEEAEVKESEILKKVYIEKR